MRKRHGVGREKASGSDRDEARLAEWARARGLELTPDSRPVVARYLRRARVLRACGVVAGILLPTLVALVWHGRLVILGFHTDGSGAPYAGPMEAYVGYLVGAVCAEVSVARPRDPRRRAASLLPRDLDDYLPRRLVLAQRALGIAVAIGIAVIALVPYAPTSQPGWASLAGGAVFFGGFAIALEALERWIVRRPQPYTSAPLIAADDAIRAHSVHALAGSGLALLLVGCSGVFAVLTLSDVDVLTWTMWLPALAAFVLSIRACLDVGALPWRVRRSGGRAAPA